MKRYLHMRSPENSMEFPRRSARKRQTPGTAWGEQFQSTSQQGIIPSAPPCSLSGVAGPPRRFYPPSGQGQDNATMLECTNDINTTRKESIAGQQITYPPQVQFNRGTRSGMDLSVIEKVGSTWSEEEDAVLREGVLRFGNQSWDQVAAHVLPVSASSGSKFMRSSADCSARWDAVVKNTIIKGPWLQEEDALLRQLVTKFGPKRWALIASHIPGRAGKQCRERWLNHLDTRVVKGDWSADEDSIIIDAQQRVGNKWSEIARQLPGRAENAVKNRYNSLVIKKISSDDHSSDAGDPPSQQASPTGDTLDDTDIQQSTTDTDQTDFNNVSMQTEIQNQQKQIETLSNNVKEKVSKMSPPMGPPNPSIAHQQFLAAQQCQPHTLPPKHESFLDSSMQQDTMMTSTEKQTKITSPSHRDENDVQHKTPKELLSLMFRRIGESEHIASQIARHEVKARTEDLCLTDGTQRNSTSKIGQSSSGGLHLRPQKQGLDKVAELQGMALAHRFWGQERERDELFKHVAFTAGEWEQLEAKAIRQAIERPRDIALTAAAATAALGHRFNALAAQHRASIVQQQQVKRPKKQRGGHHQLKQPNYCPSPGRGRKQSGGRSSTGRSGGRTKSRGRGTPQNLPLQQVVPPPEAAQSITKIVDDTLKLSGTLLHLSLEDQSWLNDVVDVGMSRDPGREAMKMSWTASPRASMNARGMPQEGQQLGRSSAGGALLKSYNYDDWANAPLGVSAIFGAGNTSAFAGSLEPPMVHLDPNVAPPRSNQQARGAWGAPIAPQVQNEQQKMQSQQHRTEAAARLMQTHDTTSMSLDNVDWDLILKMSNNTPRHDSILGAHAASYRESSTDKQNQDNVLMMSQDFETASHTMAPPPVSRGTHKGLVVEIPTASQYGTSGIAPNDETSHLTPRARQLFSHAANRGRK